MAVGAILRRADARSRVREVRVECLAAIAFSRKCLLLRINPFAVRVLRTDDDRARGADHGHAVLLYRAVDAEHEDVVAHHLWVVGSEVSIGHAFEFILRDALVGFHRQVTTETTRGP